MPDTNHLRLSTCLLIIGFTSQLGFCQTNPAAGAVTWESAVLGSPEEFVQLRDSLTDLEYMMDAGNVDLSSSSLNRLIGRIEFGQRRLAAAVESESMLSARSDARLRAIAEVRIDKLNSNLATLENEAEQLSSQIELPEIALQLMSQKIGEAIIANKLRELESSALIEALNIQAKEQRLSPLHDSKVKLAERRYALAKKRLAQARELSDRNLVSKQEVDELELSELEAKTALNEILSGAAFDDSISRKITDAATDQIVSKRMQKLLSEESARVNEQLRKAAAIPLILSESRQLRSKIGELGNKLSELEYRSGMEDKNLMRANMLLKQVDETLKKIQSHGAKQKEAESK